MRDKKLVIRAESATVVRYDFIRSRGEVMANPKLKFYFREPTIDTNMPITDGTVKIEGFDWELVPDEDAADAWDCGFAARVRAFASGLPHISIPAFPNRKYRLGYILVNSKAGIEPT